jgi:hypothetical protein
MITVKFSGSRWAVYVKGPGARRELRDLRGGKPPEYDQRRRAYICTERIAADLLDRLEGQERPHRVGGQAEQPIEQGRLW